MKSLFSKYVWLQLILSILLLFGGAIIIAFAINDIKDGTQHVTDALNICVAVILFLFGGFAILATLLFESRKYITTGLLYGSASIAMGIMFCAKKLYIIEYVVYLLAIFLIVIGAVELIKAIIMTIKHKSYEVWRIVIAYVVAALFIGGGIVSLIPQFHDALQIPFCIFGGVLLFLAGVYQLYAGIRALIIHVKGESQQKENKKEKEEAAPANQPIDAEPVAEAPQPEVIEQQPEPEIKELDYTSNQIEQK